MNYYYRLILFNPSSSLENYLNNTSFLALISDHDIHRDSYLEDISSLTSSTLSSSSCPENLDLLVIFTGWITFLRSETVGIRHRTTFKISSSFIKEMFKRFWRGIISPLTTACGMDKKQSKTLIAITLLGGLVSIGTWFYHTRGITSDKYVHRNQTTP